MFCGESLWTALAVCALPLKQLFVFISRSLAQKRSEPYYYSGSYQTSLSFPRISSRLPRQIRCVVQNLLTGELIWQILRARPLLWTWWPEYFQPWHLLPWSLYSPCISSQQELFPSCPGIDARKWNDDRKCSHFFQISETLFQFEFWKRLGKS